MDKLLYVAMTGAKQNMFELALRANNLANANTDGFRGDLVNARSMQALGEGLSSRAFSMTENPGANFSQGMIKTTSRNLDIAIKGDGWIAVEGKTGVEGYTRAGSLSFDATGVLRNSSGLAVLGEAGPIILPLPIRNIQIGKDGTIAVRPQGAPANVIDIVDRIKLVKPNNQQMMRSDDGLFRLKSGLTAELDETVSLQSGAIEGSNVNAVSEMVALIDLQRQFEMQIKMMQTAEENDRSAAKLLNIS